MKNDCILHNVRLPFYCRHFQLLGYFAHPFFIIYSHHLVSPSLSPSLSLWLLVLGRSRCFYMLRSRPMPRRAGEQERLSDWLSHEWPLILVLGAQTLCALQWDAIWFNHCAPVSDSVKIFHSLSLSVPLLCQCRWRMRVNDICIHCALCVCLNSPGNSSSSSSDDGGGCSGAHKPNKQYTTNSIQMIHNSYSGA